MSKEGRQDAEAIKPGMIVEATKGDLGEGDVSKPKVEEVERAADGSVEKIKVRKGILFKKELEIPVDRVQRVSTGKKEEVVVDAQVAETDALNALGREELLSNANMLELVDDAIPTAESVREKESARQVAENMEEDARKATAEESTSERMEQGVRKKVAEERTAEKEEKSEGDGKLTPGQWLRVLGPGFLGGMAGNDASAVGTYSVDGAQNGFGHLWLLLLSTPLYQATQYACASIGRVTGMGLAELLRTHYGRWVALLASLILIIANVALIAADLVAIGSGLALLTGPLHIGWPWFVLPVAAILWYLTVYRNFDSIKKIFIIMSLVFVVYIVTAILARPNWGAVLFNTFVPHIDLGFASISSAVALLGATISPYNIFWQVQGEKEEKRPGRKINQKLGFAALDIATGVISGNLIAYFIILSSAATLFTHHKQITSASDAAQALVPILGPTGEILFAIGLIGAGLVAIPVLLASTSYAVAGTFGWPAGLSKKPWQNEGFYLILTACLIVSIIIALVRIDPISLLFWANVLSGVLAPILVVYLLVVGNSQKVMHAKKLGWLTNVGLVLTAVVMFGAAAMLFYGLFTGQNH
jgi:NRAMP (natural resistance-associated macrophage protein)-like metal ion transporter